MAHPSRSSKRTFTPTGSALPRLQDVDDLQGDDLLYYDAEMELTNMILLSIPNAIYNFVDSCKTAKEMGDRGETFDDGNLYIIQVDRETRFTNEFDHFILLASAWLLLAKAITQNFSNLTNNRLRASSNTKNQAVVQGDRVNIQSRNSGNVGRNNRRAYVKAKKRKFVMGMNCYKWTANVPSQGFVIRRTVVQTYANGEFNQLINILMDDMMNLQKQQRFAQKVQQQNETLTSQIEMYKERNRVLENITKDNNYLKEFLEADERAKRFQKQADSQLYRDREIIRDLEKQRDELSQEVKHFKQKNEELQQSQLILKRKMSENEDKYHDTILDLEEKLKKNVDMFLKIGNSLQAMFMLGPKPLSVYDQQLKHGLGYPNPYTLRQAISECPKLYVASRTGNIEIPLNVRDSEETLEEAFKSQQKMNAKMNNPIAVANKQNCWTIDYKQLNALYNDFVPQKESFVEQTCPSSPYTPFVKILETKTMPSELPLINGLLNIQVGFEKLFLLIKQNSKRASMFYTSQEEIALNAFCRDQVKPLLNELLDHFDGFQNLFQRDIKEMKDAFEQNDVYLDEIERQNDLLKDQLLEASLKHDIELCVLLNHECVDESLHDELEQVKKEIL
ncbi:hypothetical protein Tco_0760516 [Tanacetum coccineum]